MFHIFPFGTLKKILYKLGILRKSETRTELFYFPLIISHGCYAIAGGYSQNVELGVPP